MNSKNVLSKMLNLLGYENFKSALSELELSKSIILDQILSGFNQWDVLCSKLQSVLSSKSIILDQILSRSY